MNLLNSVILGIVIAALSYLSMRLTLQLVLEDDAIVMNKSQQNLLRLVTVFLVIGFSVLGLWLPKVSQVDNQLIVQMSNQLMAQILLVSFTAMLVIVGIVDGITRYIYDNVLWGFSLAHLILLFILKQPLWDHLLGGLLGFAMYGVIYLLAKWFYGKEGFGFGDVLLLGAVGLVQGKQLVLITGFFAFYIALFYVIVMWVVGAKKQLKEMISFGPFICLSAWLMFIFGHELFQLYLGLFN